MGRACRRGLTVRRVVALRPRLPLHLVAGRARHRRPRHRECPDPRRHRHARHLGRRRRLRRPRRFRRGRAVIGIRLRRDHPHRVLRARRQAGNRVARACRRGLPVRRVVALRPRLPLHLVSGRARHRRPRHIERPDPRRHCHTRHLGRRRRLRRACLLRRRRTVVGIRLRRDHPHRVFRARRQAGDRVGRACRRGLPVRRVVALRPRLPLHLVAGRARHCRPRHREIADPRRNRHACHLARRRRLRRPRHFRRGRTVIGARLRRDHPHRVLRTRRQAGDRVARARRRGLPVCRVVALRPRFPLHLVAGRARHRRPRNLEIADPRRYRHPGHLAWRRRRRRRRPCLLCRGRTVVGVCLRRDHLHRVFRARRQAGNRVARHRPHRGLTVRRVVALHPRLPLHLVAGRSRHRRPRYLEIADPRCHRHARHLARRRRLRRPRHFRRGRTVIGARLRRDHLHRVLRARRQAGDRVARARCRSLPVRSVVALRPRFPLHLVAGRSRHRRPRHLEIADPRRHHHSGHLAGCAGVGERADRLPRRRVAAGGVEPHPVLGVRSQTREGVRGRTRVEGMGGCDRGRTLLAKLKFVSSAG